ncbi:cardiolipin synthase [Pseudaestuariivita atlantica]|uniref:cardiolipin synthase n=1 Tax=Pseudaestuariivita atlantica TaxID=1317121 RepID=UPI0009E45975|nr:cardiolipin synthase [Pseudaestuariivita atlantica]
MTSTVISILAVIGIGVTAYCVWRAIISARTPQGAVAWTVFLVSSPWFAVPAFLVLGRRKLRDYRAEWRRSREIVRGFGPDGASRLPQTGKRAALTALERIGGLPFAPGNQVQLLVNGDATFDAICAAIDDARTTVCVQFYTIRDDTIGRRLSEHLVRAAKRGVKVRTMYDGVGSQKLSNRWVRALEEAGVVVLNPDQARGPTSRIEINFRNHRKTVIIDGVIAFIGGHNVGDEYLGRDPKVGPWRDTHLEVRGPVALQAQMVFAEDWHWASGEALGDELDWKPPGHAVPGTGQIAALVPTGPGDEMDSGTLMFITAISAASERIWIASPYFVPDSDILSALIAAALAGKDVRILLPEAIDHYLPWLAAHAYFDQVRAAGVRIMRYKRGFMHQKVILIDDDLAAVGTANLDNRSFRLNFESMVFVADTGFAGEVEEMLRADFEQSQEHEIRLQDCGYRIRYGAPVARLWAPVL